MTRLSIIARFLLLTGIACTPVTAALAAPAPPVAPLASARDATFDLGAVIDYRRVGVEGLTVLAVTPGGQGERLGLRPGDRIVSANGISLGATNRPSAVLASAISSGGGQLRLEIVRDGQPRTLTGALGRDGAAGSDLVEGCGHLTASGPHPRAGRDVFPVMILSIDGDNKLPHPPGYHRVDGGRRVLVVRELIDDHRFSSFGLAERKRQRAREGTRLDKVLIVDVQPGMTYAVGAQQTGRPLTTSSIRDNSHWEPVVWRSYAEPCP